MILDKLIIALTRDDGTAEVRDRDVEAAGLWRLTPSPFM